MSHTIITKTQPTFYFIGVTTSQSSSMRVFPRWVQALGRAEVVIEGLDFVPHDEPEGYRQAVAQIKHDPLSLGALVTTHKIDLLDAARNMFDELGPYAMICDEVSSISKRGGRLIGSFGGGGPVGGGVVVAVGTAGRGDEQEGDQRSGDAGAGSQHGSHDTRSP